MSTTIRHVVIIGAGRAGQALRRSLLAIDCTVKLMRRAPVKAITTDLVLLCVPEAVVATIEVNTTALVCHVAGSLPMTIVHGIRRGVFHPLASLQVRGGVPPGTLFAIEANTPKDRRALFALARELGGEPVRVADDQRVRYHAGAVIAGNLATALLQVGIEQLAMAGVDEPAARRGLSRLLRSTADAAYAAPLANALTGPVARASTTTIQAHLDVLTATNQGIYAALTAILIDTTTTIEICVGET
jgi:predicted short-subunit dehydrogenase-like oxidoreductase (DUF2520 family)